MSVAFLLLHKKCSDTVVAGFRAVSLFAKGLRCSLKRSTFGFCYVFFVTVVTLYHVDEVFGVAVNVMINKSSFACRIKCIISNYIFISNGNNE